MTEMVVSGMVDLEDVINELRGCITVEGDLNPLQLKEICDRSTTIIDEQK
ncbi:MAG: hypothetical protein K9W43_06685 [Candidatus Thorarchaeota archaeon]|nr:hypothetical protein [Candidatus Thorarchaeota archaeon]